MPSKSEEIKIPRRFDCIKKMYLSSVKVNADSKIHLINWFFEEFGNHEIDKSSYTCELLWKTFHEILEIERQCSSGHRIPIKSNAIMNLLNAVANYPFSSSWAYVILSSTAILLETPTMNATLIADVDTLFLFLIATLNIITKIYKVNCEEVTALKEAKNLCSIILNILENLSASNDDEKALLLSGSLQDLATFMHIAESDKELDYLSEKLAKKITSVVFNLKSKQYETLLTPVDSSCAVERPNACIVQFFLSLHKLLMNESIVIHSVTVNAACATFMKKLLAAFLVHNKCTLHSLKIMSLFFAVAGLDIPIVLSANSCCNSLFEGRISNSEVLMIGLSHVLEACSTVSQYFTSMAVSEGYIKPSIWLKGVSAALLDAKIRKNKSSWLKCFQSLVMISPSIIENDVLPLIKIAFLNISVHSTESRKQYCALFDIVIQAHSKLHQVPKFFVKLLLALTECIKENLGGTFLENGQILPQIQESIARCVQELPYGQMIELWKIFIETFSSLENMSQAFMINKSFIFFVAQLFSTFLLHAQLYRTNIPSKFIVQFGNLIENTSEEIKKNISALKEKNSMIVPLQRSVLLLCYAIGEVKLAYKVHYEKSTEESFETLIPEDTFNFSMLHSFLDKDYASMLETYINSDDEILKVLVFQLLLQKCKALDLQFKKSEKEKGHMKESILAILKHLQESYSASESWDMDICTVNVKNYGTAYWKLFLKVFPGLLKHLDANDFYNFCHSAQNVILQDDSSDTCAKSVILASLKRLFLEFSATSQDSQLFQIAFVSVIWRRENLLHCKKRSHDDMETGHGSIEKIFVLLNAYHLKSLKYAKRTPKSNKNLGSIWNEIKEISNILNDVLISESLPRDKLVISQIYDVIKLFNLLPLNSLLPGNQMKCITGLSLLFFLVPQSCKSSERVSVAKEISLLLLSIFEGVRSIWLFDFVRSGPYLKFVVKTLESVIDVECYDNHNWALQLIEHLISLIVRNVEALIAVEKYISELAVKDTCSRVSLYTQCALLKKLSQVLLHPHKQEKCKEALIRISSIASQGFIKQMKLNFKVDVENSDYIYFIKCYTHVIEIVCSSTEVVTIGKKCLEPLPSILETTLNKVKNLGMDVLSDVYLLLISKVCKHATKLSAFLSEDFVSFAWKVALYHFEKKIKKKKESLTVDKNLKSAPTESLTVNNLCVFCSCYSNNKILLTMDQDSKNIECTEHDNDKILSTITLNEFEKELLKELSIITTTEKLAEIFQDLLKQMSSFGVPTDILSLQMSISIFQCLIDANNENCKESLLNHPVETCMSHLYDIVHQVCSSTVCLIMVLIPILDFTTFVIKKTKSLPRQVLLESLHCVIPVPLEVHNDDFALFVKSFSAAWKLVYDLFMYHTALIQTSPTSFLPLVAKLLVSIVKAGSVEPLSRCGTNTYQEVQLCAQNMNRLLTVITRCKSEFSKLVPSLVGHYVDAVQHITLDSNIKEPILSGIHRLLDICSEESIKMQAVNISYVCSEIYGNLVKNYRQNKHISVT